MVFIILILVSLWNARRIVVIEEVPGELVPFGSLAVFVVRWGLVGGHWVGGGRRLGLWYTAGHLHEFICGIVHVVTIMVQTKRVCHIEFFSLFSKKLVLFLCTNTWKKWCFFNNYYENMYYKFQTELNNVLKNKQFIFKDRIWP